MWTSFAVWRLQKQSCSSVAEKSWQTKAEENRTQAEHWFLSQSWLQWKLWWRLLRLNIIKITQTVSFDKIVEWLHCDFCLSASEFVLKDSENEIWYNFIGNKVILRKEFVSFSKIIKTDHYWKYSKLSCCRAQALLPLLVLPKIKFYNFSLPVD